jgi:hypothetical protein
MKFFPVPKETEFAEDNQAINIEFAFARKKGPNNFEGLTALSKCRDFLGDALFAEATKCVTYIYSFKYDGTGKAKLPKTYSCFALRFTNKEQQQTFIKYYDCWENLFSGIAGTKKGYVKSVDNICIVVTDKEWSRNNFGVSLYTFLLKGIVIQEENKPATLEQFHTTIKNSTVTQRDWNNTTYENPTNEAGYMNKISKNELHKAIRIIKKINKCPTTFGGSTYVDVHFDNTIHHNSGFVSSLQWKKNEFWKLYESAK